MHDFADDFIVVMAFLVAGAVAILFGFVYLIVHLVNKRKKNKPLPISESEHG